MSERAPREQWSQKHREDVRLVEKIGAAVAIMLGSGIVVFGPGSFAGYVGAGLIGAGAFMLFPPIRPLLSSIVERLPFLADKTDPPNPPESEVL